MFFLHRIWNWCSRFRHRCGYGVHSPSDFFLITSVVYEKYHYYAYRVLKERGFPAYLPLNDRGDSFVNSTNPYRSNRGGRAKNPDGI